MNDSTHSALIVAAHQDDEVIGLGSRLPSMKDSAIIVHTTDGAPLKDALAAGFADQAQYAAARREELLSALALAGISAEHCSALDFADQQASHRMAEIAARLHQILLEMKPFIVFTHPYEGGHPDHDATAFAVHAAVQLMPSNHRPAVSEFTSYHAGPNGLETNRFLPYAGLTASSKTLSEPERTLKARMFDCFVTQRHVLPLFPLTEEKVRPAPRYRFDRAPHPGKLHYENFDWGMNGNCWRALAREAKEFLGISDQWD